MFFFVVVMLRYSYTLGLGLAGLVRSEHSFWSSPFELTLFDIQHL